MYCSGCISRRIYFRSATAFELYPEMLSFCNGSVTNIEFVGTAINSTTGKKLHLKKKNSVPRTKSKSKRTLEIEQYPKYQRVQQYSHVIRTDTIDTRMVGMFRKL